MPAPGKAKTYRARQLPCILTSLPQVASFLAGVVPGLAADDVHVLSLATSLNLLEIPPTKVATLMFVQVPPVFDDSSTEWVISGQTAGLLRDLIFDVHFQDFTPLNDVLPEAHSLDCIAVSGLASHPFGSWQQRGPRTSFMWLRDRLPHELPNVRSIIYGYDTALVNSESVKGVNDIAVALIAKMKSIGRGSPSSQPLVIIAHSLGGIVVKQAMVAMARAHDFTGVMLESICRTIFFGVPNRGMQISHLLPMVHGRPNSHLTQLLSTESDYLEELDHQFSGIVEYKGIEIMSIYETKRTETPQKDASGQWTKGGPKVLLVDKSSAIQRKSSLNMPMDEDHSNMAKFAADDQNCQAILSFILDSPTTNYTPRRPGKTKNPAKKYSRASGRFRPDTKDEYFEKAKSELKRMCSSLYVPESGHRLSDIEDRHESTFEWIFDDKSINFAGWLKGPGKIFWINGKPGCGKSTIMKLIRNDDRTRKLFADRPDVDSRAMGTADFFFHDRGSAAQKSIEGMLSRILYQLLKDLTIPFCVVELILPIWERLPSSRRRRTESEHDDVLDSDRIWTLDSLRQILEIILNQHRTPVLLLFFLDALDEFDGEPQLIAGFVRDLIRPREGSYTEVKVCCSSRPWNVFRDSFNDLDSCRVHEHTREDISRYINAMFETNPRMREMMALGSVDNKKAVQTLKTALSERAEGVFVWVKLVTDELLRACTDGSIPEELLELLSSIPADLDKTYQRLIDRIPLNYRFESYVFIEVVLRNQYTFGLRDLGLTLLCALGKSITSVERLPSDPFSGDFLAATRRRLQSRCGGMLEVLNDTTVQFMHQTAKEYFSRPGASEAILAHDAKLCVENGFTFIAKFYLTLAYARSGPFNGLPYLLTMFQSSPSDSHRIRLFPYYYHEGGVHYTTGSEMHMKFVSRALGRKLSTDHFLLLMDHSPFRPKGLKDHCMSAAYMSEVSTGRTLCGFLLSKAGDEAIQNLFSFVPACEFRSGRRCTSVKDFAREAGLRLFLEESGIPPVSRRPARREPTSRRRRVFADECHVPPLPPPPRSRPAPPWPRAREERQRPVSQQGRYHHEAWESGPRTASRNSSRAYAAYASPFEGLAPPREQQGQRYYSPGPHYYYYGSTPQEPLLSRYPTQREYYQETSRGQRPERYEYERFDEEYWHLPSRGNGGYHYDGR